MSHVSNVLKVAIQKDASRKRLDAVQSALSERKKKKKHKKKSSKMLDLDEDLKIDQAIEDRINEIVGKQAMEREREQLDRKFDEITNNMARDRKEIEQLVKSQITLFQYKYTEDHKKQIDYLRAQVNETKVYVQEIHKTHENS